MSDLIVLSRLTRDYAILRGKFNDAERAVEPVFGLRAIREAWIEIESTKKLLRRKMDQIEGTILQFDPSFEKESVKPLRPPAPTRRAPGAITRPALVALRKAGRPLTSREIAKIIAPTLGIEAPDNRSLGRLSSAINNVFDKYVLRGRLILVAENPKRWALASASSRGAASADARPDAASSPSNPARSAA